MTQAVLNASERANSEIEGLTSRSQKTRIPVVYFARVEQDDYLALKIGFTGDGAKGFAKRLATHRSQGVGKPRNVEPICVVKGIKNCEDGLLNFFRRHLYEGKTEEFKPHADVLDYVRWLRDNYFVWVPGDAIGIDDLPAAHPDIWMPREGGERRKREHTLLVNPENIEFAERVLTCDDYYTNRIIMDAARQTLGSIDLDPASHAVANRTVRAKKFYDHDTNGLLHKWKGRVWLNPPFSEWEAWSAKLMQEWGAGDISEMCALAACRTITAKYLKPVKDACNGMCILHGRIPFEGKGGDSPDDGHVIFYFGKEFARFAKAFAHLGTVFGRPSND